MHATRSAALAALAVVSALVLSSPSALATTPALGAAGTFAILGLSGGSVTINSSTSIIGNVGYCAGVVSHTNQKVSSFSGAVSVHSTADFACTNATFAPSLGIHDGATEPGVDAALDQANSDAVAASAAYAALPPTHVLGALGDNDDAVITSVGPLNVVALASLNYKSDHLSLVSRPGQQDVFIINVSGDFFFSSSSIDLTGIGAGQVLFNFPNASTVLLDKSENQFRGTILAPLASVEYHNPAVFEGAIIARTINLHSAFNLTFSPFGGGATPAYPTTWGALKASYR